MSKYLVLLLIVGAVTAQQKVNVDIYYESLCDDSIKFFKESFVPAWNDTEVQNHINLKLVPYGKSTPDSSQDKWNCHHGHQECVGNKFQSCVIDTSSRLNVPQQMYLVGCLMRVANKNGDYMQFVDQCTSEVHTSGLTVNELKECTQSQKGNELYKKNQDTTSALQRPLQSVPTIVFNNKYDKAESEEAQKSFLKVLCKYITDPTKPKACSTVSGAPSTTATAGLLTVVSAGLIYRML